MEFKLNPLWSIQNKKNWWYPIVTAVFFLITTVAMIGSEEGYYLLAFMAVLFGVTNVTTLLSNNPHALCLSERGISYRQNYYIRYRHSHKNHKRIRTELTVSRVDSIELRQNAVEKLFHTGHVIIKGHTEWEFLRDYSEYYKERVEVPDLHVLYGIRDFDKFRNEIYDHVDPAILQIHTS